MQHLQLTISELLKENQQGGESGVKNTPTHPELSSCSNMILFIFHVRFRGVALITWTALVRRSTCFTVNIHRCCTNLRDTCLKPKYNTQQKKGLKVINNLRKLLLIQSIVSSSAAEQ